MQITLVRFVQTIGHSIAVQLCRIACSTDDQAHKCICYIPSRSIPLYLFQRSSVKRRVFSEYPQFQNLRQNELFIVLPASYGLKHTIKFFSTFLFLAFVPFTEIIAESNSNHVFDWHAYHFHGFIIRITEEYDRLNLHVVISTASKHYVVKPSTNFLAFCSQRCAYIFHPKREKSIAPPLHRSSSGSSASLLRSIEAKN